ncbi:hypothetical protein CR513_51188, partial [Mucuna pruriens]
METGYGIQKLRPVQDKTLDLQSLRRWGSFLKGQWYRTFEGRYDNLLSLLEIKVQANTLSALICFTSKDFQLAPTLEEYERIIDMPLAKSLSYPFRGKYPS